MIPGVQTAETGDENATLLVCDSMQCFGKKVLAIIAPYMFILHTKKSIIFRKGRSSNYILETQPGKLMIETFS